jgi:hypothetical protein
VIEALRRVPSAPTIEPPIAAAAVMIAESMGRLAGGETKSLQPVRSLW